MRNTISTILISTILSFTAMADQNPPVATTTNNQATVTEENVATKQEEKATAVDSKQDSAYEKIIEDFKDYALKVKPEIREEIKTFREKMDDINADKGKLYKALSSEAKSFLKKEREFKKNLKQKIDDKQTADEKGKDSENTTSRENTTPNTTPTEKK